MAPRPELWSLLHGDVSEFTAETWGRTLLVEGPVKGENGMGVGRGTRVSVQSSEATSPAQVSGAGEEAGRLDGLHAGRL